MTQSTIDESVISPSDTVGKVMGEEHSGRVRCLGLGAAPSSSFGKPRLHAGDMTNPTESQSSCSSQCQENYNTLLHTLKSYMIMKEGQIPQEFVEIFSSPLSTVILIYWLRIVIFVVLV